MNWIILKKNIETNRFDYLYRNHFNLTRYHIHKFLLKKNNINLSDYISNKYLKNKKYNLVKNAFPYNLEKNILHLVLWINDLNITNIKQIIKKELEIKYKKEHEFLFFENPKHLRSINDIKHFHIFVKLH